MSLKVKRLDTGAILPTRAHAQDAGLDLYSAADYELSAYGTCEVLLSISLAIPEGHVGLILGRSSLARLGVAPLGGVIDAGYIGPVSVVLQNHSAKNYRIKQGERIAQMLIVPIALPAVSEVDVFDDTPRGRGGFGSTGR